MGNTQEYNREEVELERARIANEMVSQREREMAMIEKQLELERAKKETAEAEARFEVKRKLAADAEAKLEELKLKHQFYSTKQQALSLAEKDPETTVRILGNGAVPDLTGNPKKNHTTLH